MVCPTNLNLCCLHGDFMVILSTASHLKAVAGEVQGQKTAEALQGWQRRQAAVRDGQALQRRQCSSSSVKCLKAGACAGRSRCTLA
jgi:hypothetical protein